MGRQSELVRHVFAWCSVRSLAAFLSSFREAGSSHKCQVGVASRLSKRRFCKDDAQPTVPEGCLVTRPCYSFGSWLLLLSPIQMSEINIRADGFRTECIISDRCQIASGLSSASCCSLCPRGIANSISTSYACSALFYKTTLLLLILVFDLEITT